MGTVLNAPGASDEPQAALTLSRLGTSSWGPLLWATTGTGAWLGLPPIVPLLPMAIPFPDSPWKSPLQAPPAAGRFDGCGSGEGLWSPARSPSP